MKENETRNICTYVCVTQENSKYIFIENQICNNLYFILCSVVNENQKFS